MPDVIIANPVINSPFREPERRFYFGDDGITDTIEDGRRRSSYFIPIASPRKKSAQLVLDTDEHTKLRGVERQLVASTVGFAVVIPGWKVLEMLDEEWLVRERERRDSELRRSLDAAGG